MKKKNLWIIALVAIITLTFVGCGGNETSETYTITFDADNGNQITTQTVNEGSKAVKPAADPIKNGSIFNYWFNVATNNEWDFNTAITANVSLKAKWTPEQLVTKNYSITFKDGTLVFVVEYIALPSDEKPAYITYLETRLALVVNQVGGQGEMSTNFLISKGNRFNIEVEYAGITYAGIFWNSENKVFRIHNDWISVASNGDLSAATIRDAFNAVE
jgi:hypothetical protein